MMNFIAPGTGPVLFNIRGEQVKKTPFTHPSTCITIEPDFMLRYLIQIQSKIDSQEVNDMKKVLSATTLKGSDTVKLLEALVALLPIEEDDE